MCFACELGAASLEYRQPLDAEKSKDMDSLLRASRRNQPNQYFDFTPGKQISDFWPIEI